MVINSSLLFFYMIKLLEQESVLDQPIIPETKEIDSQYLEAEKQKFNAAIDNLDSVLIRLEQLWLSHV